MQVKNNIFDSIVTLINILLLLFFSKRSIIVYFVLVIIILSFKYRDNPIFINAKNTTVEYSAKITGVMSNLVNIVIDAKNFLISINNMAAENIYLHKKIVKLKAHFHKYEKISAENKELKNLLSYTEKFSYPLASARILQRSDGNSFTRSLVIDAGINKKLVKGLAIINYQGLVGRITQIYDSSARVISITDINSRIPIVTINSRVRAIAAGNSSNTLDILYLRPDHKLEEGELVISSGDDGIVPYGVAIGKIAKIKEEKYIIKPFINLDKIEYVTILAINDGKK